MRLPAASWHHWRPLHNNCCLPNIIIRGKASPTSWAARAKVRGTVQSAPTSSRICASGGAQQRAINPARRIHAREMPSYSEEAHKLGARSPPRARYATIKDAIRAGIDPSNIPADRRRRHCLAKQHGTYLVFDIYNDDYILQEGAKQECSPSPSKKEKKSAACSVKFPHTFSIRREDGVRYGFRRLPTRRQRAQFGRYRMGHEASRTPSRPPRNAADLLGLADRLARSETGTTPISSPSAATRSPTRASSNPSNSS